MAIGGELNKGTIYKCMGTGIRKPTEDSVVLHI
jgi:hypothetical protein